MGMMLPLSQTGYSAIARPPGAIEWIQEGQDILKILRENIQVAQNQQKIYVDRHRVERSFEVGDFVYLRLQPYR